MGEASQTTLWVLEMAVVTLGVMWAFSEAGRGVRGSGEDREAGQKMSTSEGSHVRSLALKGPGEPLPALRLPIVFPLGHHGCGHRAGGGVPDCLWL